MSKPGDMRIEIPEGYSITRNRPSKENSPLHSPSLFDPNSLERDTNMYNIVDPKLPFTDSNPKLLAMNTRLKKNIFQPTLLKKKNNTDRLSLFNRKPLSSLQRETPMQIEQKKEEQERRELNFSEDPISYFSKHKDGSGHKFIYLVHEKSRDDPDFSPYELKKVIFKEVGSEYYTMSPEGVTYIDSAGNTYHTDIESWVNESTHYNSIRKLPFFNLYKYWKNIRLWKNFVQTQRYQMIKSLSIEHPLLQDKSMSYTTSQLAIHIYKYQVQIAEIMLPFKHQRKMKLKDIEIFNEKSISKVEVLYKEMIEQIAETINHIYLQISDPQNLVVKDEDYNESRRVNPNIQQMMLLEIKKKEDKELKLNKMDTEIRNLIKYVRLVDYMILELLREGCFKTFSENADIVVSDKSEVFQIDVKYDEEGGIEFEPSLDKLFETVDEEFNSAIQNLQNLPRIYKSPQLKKLLTYTVEKPKDLFVDGTSLEKIMESSTFIQETKERMYKVMKDSFEEAKTISQSFTDYYRLYKMGQSWSVKNYIKRLDGSLYDYELNIYQRPFEKLDSDFLMHPENEPNINLDEIMNDVKFLRTEEARSAFIRGGATCGTFYVDSLTLRGKLNPIPKTILADIGKMLGNFVQLKIDLLSRLFKTYRTLMKNESSTLAIFTQICELLNQIEEQLPKMTKEITNIDDINAMMESSGFTPVETTIHDEFNSFKKAYKEAVTLKTYSTRRYQQTLSSMVNEIESLLNADFMESRKTPKSVKESNLKEYIIVTQSIKKHSEELKEKIQECQRYQTILGVDVSPFSLYKEIIGNVNFSEALQKILGIWESIKNAMSFSPFIFVDITKLEKDFEDLTESLDVIHQIQLRSPAVLIEIEEEKKKYEMYMTQIHQLAVSKLKENHWKLLFSQSGKDGLYKNTSTVDELIQMGILSNTKSIETITEDSIGESTISADFANIRNKWEDIPLPIVSVNPKSPTSLIIGQTTQLIQDINDTLITLDGFLSNKYIDFIRYDLMGLHQRLTTSIDILNLWTKFQQNWIIVEPIFKNKLFVDLLKDQQTNYLFVFNNFKNIAIHALENSRLLSICWINNIIQTFTQINDKLDIILSELGIIAESKRREIPRLYLLSDYEIISMLSTNNFDDFCSIALKLLCKIKRLDYKTNQPSARSAEFALNMSNFSTLAIFSCIGEDGDTLPLINFIQCQGSMEIWLNQLFEMMSSSLLNSVLSANNDFKNLIISEWSASKPSYVCMLSLLCWFTQSFDECLTIYETNPLSFRPFEGKINSFIQEMSKSYNNSMNTNEMRKVSSLIMLLNNFLEKLQNITEKSTSYSQNEKWRDELKFYINDHNKLCLSFMGDQWEHGLEFWGDISDLDSNLSFDKFMHNFYFTRKLLRPSIIYNERFLDDTKSLNTLAMLYGSFIFNIPAFYNRQNVFMEKIMKGVINNGFWVNFVNAEQLSHENLSFISDITQNIAMSIDGSKNEVEIGEEKIKINQNLFVFLSISTESLSNGRIPPQLLSFSRKTAYIPPDLSDFIRIKLFSLGYRSAPTSSMKMSSLFNSISKLIIPLTSMYTAAENVIQQAYEIIQEIKYDITQPFFTQTDDYRMFEEYSLSRSTFYYFMNFDINENQKNLLLKLIHSSLNIEWEENVFYEKLIQSKVFKIDYAKSCVIKFAREYFEKYNSPVFVDYFAAKVWELYQMMEEKSVIIISGPSNSGKTMIVDSLSFINQKLINLEKLPKLKSIEQIQKEKVFIGSSSWEKISGYYAQNHWHYGVIESAINHLFSQKQQQTHKILVLDGELTNNFVNLIDQSLIKPNLLLFSYGNSMPIGDEFHIFVETNNLSNITPSLLSRVGILSLDSLQLENNYISNNLSATLKYPEIPLNMILMDSNYNGFEKEMIKKTISENLPKIIEISSNFKSLISLTENIGKIANDIINFTLLSMKLNQINVSNTNDIRISLVISSVSVLLSYFEPNIFNEFEKQITNEFGITLPSDWSGLQIPDELWDYYPKPTLSLMRYYKSKIIPINFESISKTPFKKFSNQFYFPEDYIVYTPQNLRQYNLIKTMIENKQNVILSGPISSGKTSLMRAVLKDSHQIDPVFVNISKFTTTNDLLTFFVKMTNLVSKHKKLEQTNKYQIVLVFENVEKENYQIVELLRMMLENKEMLDFAKISQKYFPKYHLSKFNYVICSRDFSQSSPRFLSNFVLIRIDEPSTMTKNVICKKQLLNSGVNSNLALFTSRILQNLNLSLTKMQSILIPLCNIPERSGKTNQTKFEYCKMFFSMLFIEQFCFVEDVYSSFFDKTEILFDEYELARAYQQIQIDPAHYDYSIDNTKMDVKQLDTITIDLLLKEKCQIELNEKSSSNYAMISHSLKKIGKPIIVKADDSRETLAFVKMMLPIKTTLVDFIFDKSDVKKQLKEICNRSVFNEQLHYIVASIHENEEELYDLLTSVFIYYDFPIIFNEIEIEKMCQKMANEENLTIDLRMKSINEIKTDLSKNTRLIIITNEIFGFMNDCHYDKILTQPPTLKMFCNQYLQGPLKILGNIISTIMESITDIIPYNNSTLEKELIKIFSQKVDYETKENERQIDRIQKANEFLDTINSVYKKSSDYIEDLKIQKSQFEQQLIEMKKIIEESNENISIKKGQLGETLKNKNLKILEQVDLLEEAEFNKNNFKAVLDLKKEDLPKLRESCISSDPNVRVIIETVFSLLGVRAIEDDFIEKMNSLNYEDLNLNQFQLFSLKIKENPLMDKTLNGQLQAVFKFLTNAMKITESSIKKQEIQKTLRYRQKSAENFNILAQKEQRMLKDEQNGVDVTAEMVQNVANGIQHIKKQLAKEEEKRRIIEQITKDISILKMKWDDKYEIYQKRSTTIPCDELLYSFYLIYGGLITSRSSKGDILDAVMDAITAKNYESSYSQQLDCIEDAFLYPEDISFEDFIPSSLRIDISHILKSPITPLVIDPDHLAIDAIAKAKKATVVSVYDPDFDEKIKESKFLIVLEISSFDSKIEKLILSTNKLILVSSCRNPKEIDKKLTKECLLIDCSESTLDSVKNNVSKVILSKFDSDIIPKLIHNQSAEKSLNDDIDRFMDELIDTLAYFQDNLNQTSRYDLSADKENLTKMFAAKDYLIQTMTNTPNFGLVQKEYSQMQQSFGPVLEAAEKMWIVLSRKVSLLSKNYCFNFDYFIKLLDSTLEKSVSAAKTIQEAKKKVINSVIRWVSSSLSCPDFYFFLFTSSFLLKHGNSNDYEAILDHMSEILHDKIGNLQIDYSASHAIENLKYGPVETVFKLIESYVSDVIGVDYLTYIVNYSTDLVLNQMNKLPTIIFTTNKKYDMINNAVDYALARGLSDQFSFISLNLTNLEKSEKFYEEVSQTQKTLFISYSSESPEITLFVYKCILKHLDGKCHSQFKPIFIVSDSISLPPVILSKSRKIMYQDLPSPRFSVSNIIERISTLFEGIEESRNIRRILFIICIIFAQIDVLNFTRPFEICDTNCNIGDVKTVFQMIYHLFSTNEIPMRNIRDLFDEVIFSSKSEKDFSRQRISSLLGMMLSLESFDDTFTFVDPQAMDAQFWTIPKDSSIHTMLQNTLSKFPILPSLTISGMKTEKTSVILQTRLSHYVSKPFIKYNELTKEDDERNIKNINQFFEILPTKIDIKENLVESEIFKNFWLSEAKKFNEFIDLIHKTASNYENEIFKEITPEIWHQNKYNSRIRHFARQLNDIKKQIERGFANDFEILDAGLILDMNSYLLSIVMDASISKRQNLDSLDIIFSTQDNLPGSKFLENLYIMNGTLEMNELINSDAVLTKIPKLSLRVVNKDEITGRTFKIPIYDCFGGKVVYKAILPSQRAEREIVINNVSIYCTVDENMK
ncbi:hypothetical protein TVAG_221220 [Trichomonas vaginalis G3]|uniref:Dynein heavy chain family protein n=1 Tax=Trichomonas vaginalis (strain ATCC PRA-98 / G3) TaxID=412133 RepID=A2FWX8_TRIV3|nr:dynein heavy chain family protein family [Trichomonas vaginalis G3]EAX90579.1 hypothetical protein TVAG_221220 [Trichomonas vaginalis G3]KAI5540270.1 dynein heavy chain family protein family [Trichomonas vaginalis G3]|eukprot:XP_001303509.1 hypothetical protein [Trichomonas vaginalis G3]